MISKIRFKFKGKKYTLEFTRDSILEMERRGFDPFAMIDKPIGVMLTMLPDLFSGAFIANHADTPQAVIDEIYSGFDNKMELLDALAGMYADAIDEIVSQIEKVHNGVKWQRC